MEKRIEVNGLQFNVRIDGCHGAPWLTFSNSHATDLTLWDDQVRLLARRFRILRYDTRGHGRTGASEGAYSFDLLASDVVSLWDALDIPASHYVGLSLGGTTGIEIAIAHPDRVLSLAACDCRCNASRKFSLSWEPRIETARHDGMEGLVEPTLRRWFTSEFRARNPPVLEKVRSMIRTTSVSGYIGCAEALKRIDCEARLGRIQCPSLFLCGAQDPSAPPDLVEEWGHKVSGSRFVVIDGAAHISNLERPDAFSAAVERFLGESLVSRNGG